VLADDSGLVVPSLAGRYGLDPFPGVQSNRWLTPDRRQALLGETVSAEPGSYLEKNLALLALLGDQADRTAYFVCAMVLMAGETPILAVEGRMPLVIIGPGEAPSGSGGFGYDPIARPVMDGQVAPYTVAEMPMAEKNAISHRGRAIAQIVAGLADLRGRA
jgi:XTP/dITP diphosphohydrolase